MTHQAIQPPVAAPVAAPVAPPVAPPVAAPEPTTKPGGTKYSTAAIIMAVVSLFIGGVILAGAALGVGIRAKIMGQPRAVLAISAACLALVANAALLFLVA